MPYFKQEEVIKTAAYLRLSKEDMKMGESNSITNQRALCKDFIEANGLTLVDEYVDDGYSGMIFKRPGLQAMMEDCRAQKINCIIVKDLSRLGRDMTMIGRYIMETFPQMGIRFISILDEYDSNNTLFTGFDMSTSFRTLCNEMYAMDTSRKIRASVSIAQQEGKWLGGVPPYGYMKDPEDKHHLLVDRKAASVVRLAFDLKIAGLNSKAIAGYLNRMEIETPMQRMKRLGYKTDITDEEAKEYEWHEATITKMLQNEIYLGTMVSRKRARPTFKIRTLKRNAKEAWIRVEGMHEPIVTKETFDYVQDLFGRIHLTGSGTDKVRPMSGFVRCGDCGMVMTYRGSAASDYQYMNCSSHMRNEGCSPHSIRVSELHGKVLGEIRIHIEKLAAARSVLKKQRNGNFRQSTLARLDNEINRALEEEKYFMKLKTQIYEDKVKGILTEKDYTEMNAQFTSELTETEEKIRDLQDEKARVLAEQTNLIPWIDSLMEFRGAKELERRMVVAMIDYVFVYGDGRVEVHFRYEDETRDLFEAADETRRRKVG